MKKILGSIPNFHRNVDFAQSQKRTPEQEINDIKQYIESHGGIEAILNLYQE